jgi:hypothetical protein
MVLEKDEPLGRRLQDSSIPDAFTHLRFTLSEIRSILLKSREGAS